MTRRMRTVVGMAWLALAAQLCIIAGPALLTSSSVHTSHRRELAPPLPGLRIAEGTESLQCPLLRLRGGKRSGMRPARRSRTVSAEIEEKSGPAKAARSIVKRRKGGPEAAASAMARAETAIEIDGEEGALLADSAEYEGDSEGAWDTRFGTGEQSFEEDERASAEGTEESASGLRDLGSPWGHQGAMGEDPRLDGLSRAFTSRAGEEGENGDDDESAPAAVRGGVEGAAVEPLPQRRLRPWERDDDMEDPLEGQDDDDDGLDADNLKSVKALNFTFDLDEVTAEIAAEEALRKSRAKQAKSDKLKQAMQKPGAWDIASSACVAWDWFQGRARDTYDYSTFRHRKYGYVVQLFDQTHAAWISFSRMARTRVVYTCFSDGRTEPRKEFWGEDLVQTLVNLTVVEKRRMPFRALADGDPVVFRHSYWHGQVKGGSVVIKHLKAKQVELHLTPEGFVFVGQPSYFQGGRGGWTEIREDEGILEDLSDPHYDEEAGQPKAVWVQGAKRPQKIELARASDLLQEQDVLWRQGDNDWKFVAREARLRDAERDRALGRRHERNVSDPLDQFGDMYKEYRPVQEDLFPGQSVGSGAGAEVPPLEELVYQGGVDSGASYGFRIF